MDDLYGRHLYWIFRAENVQILILCKWPKAKFDPHDVLRGFTSLRKLTIANSNLTQLSTAFPIEAQFLEVGNACQILGKQLRTLCLEFTKVASSNFYE